MMYLDNILIYTNNPSQPQIEAMWWEPKNLKKYDLFANLKKCQFYQDEVQFFGFVVLVEEICIEDEKIEEVKTWPEP